MGKYIDKNVLIGFLIGYYVLGEGLIKGIKLAFDFNVPELIPIVIFFEIIDLSIIIILSLVLTWLGRKMGKKQ